MLLLRRWSCLLIVAATMPICSGQAANPVAQMIHATHKITNPTSTATCFLFSRQDVEGKAERSVVLVTAAHVFEAMTGDECQIVLREEQHDGTYARKEVTLHIRANQKPLWTRHPKVDVAAMAIELPSQISITSLNVSQLARESTLEDFLHCGDDVWIPCYPAQLEANEAGFPVLRRGCVASYPLTPFRPDQTFLVDYNSFGGDSGAAVFIRQTKNGANSKPSPLVVGLVIGKHRETTKTSTPNEERTVHTSLGLGIVVHAETIRQTIERLSKSSRETE